MVGMRNTYTQFNVLLSYLISKRGVWYAIANARSVLSAGQPPEYSINDILDFMLFVYLHCFPQPRFIYDYPWFHWFYFSLSSTLMYVLSSVTIN